MGSGEMAITLLPVDSVRGQLGQAARLLTTGRYAKMMSYQREEDRLRSFASSLLLQKAARGRNIFYNEAGKPLAEGLFFNLSHSGNYAVLAEADNWVGVDIEEMAPIGDWAEEALTPQEYAWMLQGVDEAQQQRRFYSLWTRKESLVKCEGHGFWGSPGEISVMPVEGRRLIDYAGKAYGLCSLELEGYMLSAALRGKEPRLRVEKGLPGRMLL